MVESTGRGSVAEDRRSNRLVAAMRSLRKEHANGVLALSRRTGGRATVPHFRAWRNYRLYDLAYTTLCLKKEESS